MKGFYIKVLEFMYEKRFNQFQSLFYDLFKNYDHIDEDSFISEWFDRFIIKKLIPYVPPSELHRSYREYTAKRRSLLKTYIRTYWQFCKNPKKYPASIRDAMRYFELNDLNVSELKSKYREKVKAFHPDRAGRKEENHREMVKINYYYQLLRSVLND